MLVLHRGFDIYVPHRLHDQLQVARLFQYTRPEVAAPTVEHQILR